MGGSIAPASAMPESWGLVGSVVVAEVALFAVTVALAVTISNGAGIVGVGEAGSECSLSLTSRSGVRADDRVTIPKVFSIVAAQKIYYFVSLSAQKLYFLVVIFTNVIVA